MKIDEFEILNPSKDCLKQDGENIVMSTSAGSMWGKGNTCQNLLLIPEFLTDVRAGLSVRLLPENDGEQAGIMLFADSDNYIKLVREMVAGKQAVVLAREIEGKPETVIIEDFESPSVELRISSQAGSLSVEWKSPESSQYILRNFENWLGMNKQVRVGIFVHGQNENNHAVFSSLKIRSGIA